ncbi:hypothetical protein [Sphingomonas sp. NFR15]|uniref:hypothetical protein n=1 Tax=Sphingomonas sp. NFR15 TaxID=1566282 RepID=UPI000883A5CF|nr:hypothetical protein [Sphingomonas sp. NFR15]SDA34671.1 hypothetical protein SAMN03159340_03080 [Sphingomonas sp. NFR15]
MRFVLAVLSIVAVAAPLIASAQQKPPELAIPADRPYRHAPSGLVIPAALDGLPRISANAFAPDHLDEAFNFGTPNSSEDITVFVFRNVAGSVPVWFDRVARIVEQRDTYGGLTIAKPAAAFTPPGQTTASGLIASYRPMRGPYRSTAMAFFPLGPDWYVELRYSSTTIDADAIDTRLRGAIAALGWPRQIEPQPAAEPVADCTAPLALTGPAKAVKGENAMASSLFAGLLASVGHDAAKKTKYTPPPSPFVWCRDTANYPALKAHGVYRPSDTTDQYLIALTDAGRGIWVSPDPITALLGKDKGEAAAVWSLTLNDVAATTSYAGRDRLPPPDQAVAIVNSEPYASRTTTWGKKRNVQVNSDSLK